MTEETKIYVMKSHVAACTIVDHPSALYFVTTRNKIACGNISTVMQLPGRQLLLLLLLLVLFALFAT
jgi:hypothetical protein